MATATSASTVVVTGGAGFIGSHVCKSLAAAGMMPVTIDNLVTGFEEAVRWGPLERVDIHDTAAVTRVLEAHRPVGVIHLAGSAYVGESTRDPAKYYWNNVTGTLELLRAMLAADVRRIVFSSTCATYGIPERLPIDEDSRQEPVNPYGRTKLIVETALKDHVAAYGFEAVMLRYFNAAGSDPDGEIGENHDPETHAIPLAIRAALGIDPAFHIFGTDYDTPDGTAVRDYIHVADLAAGHVKAIEHLAAGRGSVALNLGTGQGHSVLDIIAAVERAARRPVPAVRGPRREGDPPVLVAAPGRAREVLGWTPERSGLDEMVGDAVRWIAGRNHARAGR
jgi:UDP-arabinose 4-epimerase